MQKGNSIVSIDHLFAYVLYYCDIKIWWLFIKRTICFWNVYISRNENIWQLDPSDKKSITTRQMSPFCIVTRDINSINSLATRYVNLFVQESNLRKMLFSNLGILAKNEFCSPCKSLFFRKQKFKSTKNSLRNMLK